MSRRAVSAYHADTSGCLPKPIPGSNVEPRDRVSYLTHENLLKGLLGPGLAPILERFESSFDETITKAPIDDEWQTLPSLQEFFEEHLGSAVIKALFGSALLDQNPVFLRDLWAFDQDVMSLAKRIPSFWIPDTYKLREKLRQCFKRWHASARAHTESNGTPQEEGDSVWGSQMIQERQQMLLGVQKQDHDSVAATDFGFLWAAVTNIVPSSMTMALHLFRDVPLLASIRREVGNAAEPTSRLGFDMERLLKQPQLLSMYAETLRYGVQIHVPRFSPHRDIQIGGTRIARNKFVLVNTMLAHEDESIWNTRDGARPLSEFWAQRFLVDPKDLHSGPTKRHRIPHTQSQSSDGIHFSAEGLEGAWIPYGGKFHFPTSRCARLKRLLRRPSRLPRPDAGQAHYALNVRHNGHRVRHRDRSRGKGTRVQLATLRLRRAQAPAADSVPHTAAVLSTLFRQFLCRLLAILDTPSCSTLSSLAEGPHLLRHHVASNR